MKAFISAMKDGNSKIELVDEFGFTQDIIEVTEIHTEIDKENIEPVNRAFLPVQHKQIRAGIFISILLCIFLSGCVTSKDFINDRQTMLNDWQKAYLALPKCKENKQIKIGKITINLLKDFSEYEDEQDRKPYVLGSRRGKTINSIVRCIDGWYYVNTENLGHEIVHLLKEIDNDILNPDER